MPNPKIRTRPKSVAKPKTQQQPAVLPPPVQPVEVAQEAGPPKDRGQELIFPKEPDDWTQDRDDPLTFQFENQFDTSYDLFM
jgi:hypothetical protein